MWGSQLEQIAFGELWPLWNGEARVRNRRRAVKLLEPLAYKGYAPAQFALGWAYFDGDGVRRDYAKAYEYFLAAAEQAYPGAECMIGNLFVMARPAYNVCEYDPVRCKYSIRSR